MEDYNRYKKLSKINQNINGITLLSFQNLLHKISLLLYFLKFLKKSTSRKLNFNQYLFND